jgi:UDP-N-acetylmuramyl tripeptide synthase
VLALVHDLTKEGGRVAVIAGYAGDRGDESVRAAAEVIAKSRPSRVFLRELASYLRGRAPGEIPALITRALVDAGLDARAIENTASEADALSRALDWAKPGDSIALLVHLDRDEVRELLRARGARDA